MAERTLDDWLAHIQCQHPRDIEMGLERVAEVAARLLRGRPARRVITVAGTNGKGSTVAFIEAIAAAAGHRVGSYTSPHLLRYNERVRIDGTDATDVQLANAFERVETARGGVALTYFEFGTLAALDLFAGASLDLAVLEVGLGGRLDAVNLLDADVAVITTVDLDHQDWLGPDREAIGREKAGIMRSGRPVVLGETDPPASVLRHAYRIGAFAIRGGSDYRIETGPAHWTWREPGFKVDLPWPRLQAPAQLHNAAAAIAALRASRLRLSRAALCEGVAAASVRGRLQTLEAPSGACVVLDVGHNPQAAAQIALWLAGQPGGGRCRIVLGMLSDKDVGAVAALIAPYATGWWLAGLEAETDRGLSAEALGRWVRPHAGAAPVRLAATVAQALAEACAGTGARERVLVLGSFFTVAAALRALQDGAPAAAV